MLAGFRRRDGVTRMIIRITANRDGLQFVIAEHEFQVRVASDLASMPRAHLG